MNYYTLFFRHRFVLSLYIFVVINFLFWRQRKRFQEFSVVPSMNICSAIANGAGCQVERSSLNSLGVILILITDKYQQLAKRLSSIDQHMSDAQETHVMICHTGYPFLSDISLIKQSTKRHIIFRNVDREFTSFPLGFNPYSNDPTWSKRGKWNYHHMIRFWFKFVFEIPEIRQYDYIMRLDDDSELIGVWPNVFTIMQKRNAVYFANDESSESEDGLPGTMKLKALCSNYSSTHNVSLQIRKRLDQLFYKNTVKTYYNNFEVMNTSFFRRIAVREWVQAIDDSHGIYKYRWGDAILRRMTLTLFAETSQILKRKDYNLLYCHPC